MKKKPHRTTGIRELTQLSRQVEMTLKKFIIKIKQELTLTSLNISDIEIPITFTR